MKIKNAFITVLFFSFLFVTNYCFCQHSKESTNNKIKTVPAPITPPGILQDVKRVLDAHPQEPINNKIKVQSTPATATSTAATEGESGIHQDVKRVLDAHTQELTANKIKVQPTPTAPAPIASVQKQAAIENPVKSDAAKKSQVSKETVAGKGESSILQDVKRVTDAHP